jgi:hypothetical protein
VEGALHLPLSELIEEPDSKGGSSSGLSTQQNEIPFLSALEINGFSDSPTEQKREELRFLETHARAIHFRAISGMNADPDAETLYLLKSIVGPAVYGELVVVPVAEVFARFSKKSTNRLE